MLAEPKLKIILDLVQSSTKEELIWMNGYISGLINNGKNQEQIVPASPSSAVKKITIAYGTETGNSKKVATEFAVKAKKKGIVAKLVSLDQYKLNDLSKEEYFFTVISTQGEGEPPVGAKKFYEHIHNNGFKVSQMKYGVLALGDTSYPLYCKAGEDVDIQLDKLGGQRIVPLQKCDVDFEQDADAWFDHVLKSLNESAVVAPAVKIQPAVETKKAAGKKYYNGTIITNVNLNDRGSNKQTYHVEVTADEPIEYEPGDALALIPFNKIAVVKEIIALTGVDPALELETAKAKGTVEELLTKNINICYLLSSVIKKYAAITGHQIPDARLDLIELVKKYPVKDTSQFVEVLKSLTPIAPRLYSISSSPNAHSGEVHITVSLNRFLVNNEERLGLCSEFIGGLPVDNNFTFYIHKNRNFRLPAPEKDIIMIGPGTGIAPMRSFLAERDATGASGRNWLFFGEQHFVADFLYQTEIQNWLSTGVLTELSLAFSRDQQEKIYVQHKMKKEAAELFNWIEAGASIYISGTKDPMSKDVENTLLEIIQEQGNKSADEANAYLKKLKDEGRYEKDVY
ncbi:MAG: flavodoxin domain-containing protein [Sphingobacteriales bacterium]|nr:flavodoxin domain-containing protein [Sphingobacteriales bacterium]